MIFVRHFIKFIFILTPLWVGFTLAGCRNKTRVTHPVSHTKQEEKILTAARNLLDTSPYLSLITVDTEGQPRARVMEFIPPDEHFEIWMATNPHSRKVSQISRNSKATVHCFDISKSAYVSLMGNAYLVRNDSLKQIKWKPGWERFYPDRKKDMVLIRFVPSYLEYIGMAEGITGDSLTWAPHTVTLP